MNGKEFRAVSVRTTEKGTYNKPKKLRLYDILAIVHLYGENRKVELDKSDIFLISKADVKAASNKISELDAFKFSPTRAALLFGNLPE